MSLWLTLPVVLSVLTSALVFFSRNHVRYVEWISGVSALITLLASVMLFADVTTLGPQAVAFGQWAAPFGIVFVADMAECRHGSHDCFHWGNHRILCHGRFTT